MNKQDLAVEVSSKTGLAKKDAVAAVDAVFETIAGALASGEKVDIYKFGGFEVRKRAARKGRNPQTGEELQIPESKSPAFKPSKSLKDAVNQ